jgi:hydrogenase expression/formation protein HypC
MTSSASSACTSEHCVTCSDEAAAMVVVRLDGRRGLALCADVQGERKTVETALLDAVAPGDRVLVHAGVAIASLVPAQDEPHRASDGAAR